MILQYFSKIKPVWLQAIFQSVIISLLTLFMGFTVNHFRPDRLPFTTDWSPEARLTMDPGELRLISLDDAKKHFIDQTAVFLDARCEDCYYQGHIKGAVSLPYDQMEDLFLEVTEEVSPDTLMITYCDGEGCSFSEDLALFLIEAGYNTVKVLVNGWSLWQQSRLPIEKGTLS